MRDNVSLYKKVIFTIVIMSTFSAEADRYCMTGHKPTELEFRYARDACEEHAKTIEKLAELVAANPKNIEYKRQFDEKHRLMFQKIDNFTKIFTNIQLPKDLSECKQKNFSPEKLRDLNEKWQYMATFHSNNEEYIYNLKLLHALSIEKSFSSDK